jgi:hypothetical protein
MSHCFIRNGSNIIDFVYLIKSLLQLSSVNLTIMNLFDYLQLVLLNKETLSEWGCNCFSSILDFEKVFCLIPFLED